MGLSSLHILLVVFFISFFFSLSLHSCRRGETNAEAHFSDVFCLVPDEFNLKYVLDKNPIFSFFSSCSSEDRSKEQGRKKGIYFSPYFGSLVYFFLFIFFFMCVLLRSESGLTIITVKQTL